MVALTAIEFNYLKLQLFLTIWVIMLILKTTKILDLLTITTATLANSEILLKLPVFFYVIHKR